MNAIRPITRRKLVRIGILGGAGLAAAAALAGCGEAQIVEKEVVKVVTQEVPVEKVVTQIVEKEKVVEKVVTQIVEKEKVVEKIVEKVVTAAPAAAPKIVSKDPVLVLLRAGDGEEDFFKATFDLFRSQNPGITVTEVYVPGGREYASKLDLMIASGDPPAIFAPFMNRGYRFYAARDLSQELDEFVKRDNVDLTDLHDDAVIGSHWKGKLMALPFSLWPHMIYYNKTLFKEAGIPDLPLDENDKSWDQDMYVELSKKLTKKEGDRVVQFGSDRYFTYWASGNTFGGYWFPKDSVQIGVISQFIGHEDPKTIAAMQWSADLIYKDKVAPTAAQQAEAIAGQPVLFMSSKVGMGASHAGRLSRYQLIKDFEWSVAPDIFPKGESARNRHVWIDMWSMIKGVKNLEGSWEVLKHMVSPEGMRIYPLAFGAMTTRKSLASEWVDQKAKVHPNLGKEHLEVFTKAGQYEVMDPENWTVNFSPVYDRALVEAVDNIFLGEKSAEELITEIAPKVQQIIDETSGPF